jgi:hypothetical protein
MKTRTKGAWLVAVALLLVAQRSARAQDATAAEVQVQQFTDAYLTLEGPAFYVAVGRDDLALRYGARERGKRLSRVLGALALAGGMFGWLVQAAADPCNDGGFGPPPDPDCRSHPYWASDAVMVTGLALLLGPFFVRTDPVEPEERYQLAHDSARAYRRSLVESLRVSAAPLPGGGDLLLQVSF